MSEKELSKTEKRILNKLNKEQLSVVCKDTFTNCESFYLEDIECRLDSIRKIQLLLEEEIQILNELIE